MHHVKRMVFSTPCCTSPREAGTAAPARVGPGWRGWIWLLGLLWVLWSAGLVRADTLQLAREPSGLVLSARLDVDLPDGLEDVLLKGVPVHFVWQADVRRTRWYWTDQRVASAQRVVRLAYQPLTRRWRLSVLPETGGDPGLAAALHRNLDTLDEALAVVKSVSRWRIVAAEDLPDAGELRVDVQFRIDGGLLPRPFQVGGTGPVNWGVVYRETLKVSEFDAASDQDKP